jgi:hypothetical protein
VTGFYAVMLYTRGAGLVPFNAPYAGFFVFAMAAAFEAAYLEREAKRKRGLVCLPVVTAIVMFVILAALDTPATLFMLPMLPLNFCYSVARRGPGLEQLRLETELEGVEDEIDGVKGRLDVLWRPERVQEEPASFWLLPEALDSEIMEQLAANGRVGRSAGNENGENILDSVLEGGRGRCAHGV